MNVNFRDKNFVIATFFRDYLRAAAPSRTIHVSNSSFASEAFNPYGRTS